MVDLTQKCHESKGTPSDQQQKQSAPLIDMVPHDPDTIMTAMVEVQRPTKQSGQTITVFANDQQLYRVAVNVVWVYPTLFSEFIPRLGGMHMLMLMANSGLEDIMKEAFAGVPRMLTGNKFPQIKQKQIK